MSLELKTGSEEMVFSKCQTQKVLKEHMLLYLKLQKPKQIQKHPVMINFLSDFK